MLARARIHLQRLKMTQSQKTLSEMKMPSVLLRTPSERMAEYLHLHEFKISIFYSVNTSGDILCDKLDEHPSMPEGYCVQNIVTCKTRAEPGDNEPSLYIKAYLAPKAWHGSKERKNKNGELAELMPGIPIQKNALVEKRYKIVDEFEFPTILYQDSPLIVGEDEERLKQWLEEGKKLVAVCHPLTNRVQVYQVMDDTSVFDDIITALCVPISPTQLCYFETVMVERIKIQHRKLNKVLHDACDALHETQTFSFSFQILFRLLISELVLSKKTTLSPMLESRGCSGGIYQVVEVHGRREELQKYVDRFLLYVHAKELLFALLTGSNMSDFCKEKLYEFIQQLQKQ